jgi:hypothetical protein
MNKWDQKIKAQRRLIERIDARYRKDLAKIQEEKAKGKATEEDIQYLHADRANDHCIANNELEWLQTQKLLAQAAELDIPLPEYPQYPDHSNEGWYKNPASGKFTLTQISRDRMRDLISKRQEQHDNFRTRWTKWFPPAAIATILVAVSVAALNNWDKLIKAYHDFSAETGTFTPSDNLVTITVTDADTNKPIDQALVVREFDNAPKIVLDTDSRGCALLHNLVVGQQVWVKDRGYYDALVIVTPQIISQATVSVELHREH